MTYTWNSTEQEIAFTRERNKYVWILDITPNVTTYSFASGDRVLFGIVPSIQKVAPYTQKLDIQTRLVSIGSYWVDLADDKYFRDMVSAERSAYAPATLRFGIDGLPESEFISIGNFVLIDWTFGEGAVHLTLKENRKSGFARKIPVTTTYRGHPLEIVGDLFSDGIGSGYVDISTFDPETAIPSYAHWMAGVHPAHMNGDIEFECGQFQQGDTYEQKIREYLPLLPGTVRQAMGTGLYEFAALDPTASVVRTLGPEDGKITQLSHCQDIYNVINVEGCEDSTGRKWGNLDVGDFQSYSRIGEFEFNLSTGILNGMMDGRSLAGFARVPATAVATDVIRFIYPRSPVDPFATSFPLSGTYGYDTGSSIPAARQISSSRPLSLLFTSIADGVDELIEFDLLTVITTPLNHVFVDLTISDRPGTARDWTVNTIGGGPLTPGTISCVCADVTVQRQIGQFYRDWYSEGVPVYRYETGTMHIDLELGDIVGLTTSKYSDFNSRDGASVVPCVISYKSIDPDGGAVTFELARLVASFGGVGEESGGGVTPGPTFSNPYTDVSGVPYVDVNGTPYYPNW